MPRSVWKGPFINQKIHKKLLQTTTKMPLKLWQKTGTILPQYENKVFQIYNGKEFYSILIKENMIGHKFGEFIMTRKRFSFKKLKKN